MNLLPGIEPIVAVAVVGLGFWLPGPLYELVSQTTQIIGSTP